MCFFSPDMKYSKKKKKYCGFIQDFISISRALVTGECSYKYTKSSEKIIVFIHVYSLFFLRVLKAKWEHNFYHSISKQEQAEQKYYLKESIFAQIKPITSKFMLIVIVSEGDKSLFNFWM